MIRQMFERFPIIGSVAVSAAVVLCLCCGGAEETATLVLLHGKVVTVDEARPEAEAVALRGDRILRVGTDEEIRSAAQDAIDYIQEK